MLNERDWEQIRALQQEVEQADGISLKLNWDMLRSRRPGDRDDFVFRKDGRIAGFLALYDFASKIEVCGMVAPSLRRQGIFSALLAEALPAERACQYKDILFNLPARSSSGRGFVESLGLKLTFTEYQMKFNPELIGELRPALQEITLRPARMEDWDYLIDLEIDGFGFTREEAAKLNEEALRKNAEAGTNEILFVIELQGQNAGNVRVQYESHESWIYGFVIDKSRRGRGIGRSVLTHLVNEEQPKGRDVFLEAALENERALHLYQSCGFERVQVQEYYRYHPRYLQAAKR
ncbi:GNAT family N-acetyltransferase [Paenibacillus pinistramenti]|uniref:GNAT family N-acetyltransferase n=1 Tax=Paenibacillus pinistramenti TaxID=1768003 RepID=UPI001109609E|nr:GNAT family N-acetyltransferase [Paenibacillus pinistramenti]